MNHKLKVLGLALFAVLAVGAMTASGASAHKFASNVNTAYLTAEADPDGGGTQSFWTTTAEPNEHLDCTNVNVNGMFTGEGGGTEATSVTVEPLYTGCTATKPGLGTVAMTMTPHGCTYKFTGVTSKDITNKESAEVHLECPVGVTGIETDVTALKISCVDIEPQTLHGVTYVNRNTGKEEITIELDIHGIHSTTTETAACDEGTHTNGLYKGNITVKGYEDAAHTKQANITIK